MSETPSTDRISAADALLACAPLPVSAAERDGPLSRQEATIAIGRRAMASPDLSILLKDAAALTAETLGADHHLVAEVSPNGSRILQRLTLGSSGAAGSQPSTQEVTTSGSDSLVGYALKVAHPVVVAELAKESRIRDLWLRKHAVRSALAVPLKIRDRSFGALAACSGRPDHFDQEDVLFAETVAHLVTTTIARIHTEQALAEERRLSTEMLQTVDAMVLVLDARGQIIRINRVCEHLTGFSADEVRSRPIWEVFPVPEESNLFHTILRKLHEGVSPIKYESYLLTKQSDRRRIAWSYAATPNSDGGVKSLVATGIDVTAQRQAEQRAKQAEQAAEEARKAMDRWQEEASEGGEAGSPPTSGNLAAQDDRGPKAFDDSAITINKERRRCERRPYPYRQLIAPILHGRLPEESDFTEFECHDISPGGFSFWSPRPPPSESLVVALGNAPQLAYLTAQIAHVTRGKHKGKKMYLIGCAYLGRAAY